MKRLMMLMVAGVFALAACDEKKTENTNEPSKATTATSAAVAPKAAPQPVTIADSDLSTPADFEETAEKSITKANYKTELAALESDISKE